MSNRPPLGLALALGGVGLSIVGWLLATVLMVAAGDGPSASSYAFLLPGAAVASVGVLICVVRVILTGDL